MGKELWKKIDGFPSYSVSTEGNVRNDDTLRLLHGVDNCVGYFRVRLRNKEKKKSFYIHRLVAKAFIANELNKPCVNHIDNNPANNHVENLEWCTKQENSDWMVKQGRNVRTKKWLDNLHKSQEKTYRPVASVDNVTGFVLMFGTLNSVKNYGFQPSCVSNCCKGKRKNHAGKKWGYV